jgi:hypothetical protein
MGMKSTCTARRIPLAEGPNITAVIDKTRKLLIESMTTEPANHLPECQHCFMSHFHKGARTFERGTQPLATPTAEAAKLAAPDSKINPEALQRVVADKTTRPLISTTV